MRKEILGYDPIAVDAFLARCVATPGVYRSRFPELRGRNPSGERVTVEEIARVRFRKTALGYQIRAVDALLDELQAALELMTWRAPELRGATAQAARRISLVEAEQGSRDRIAARR